MRLPLATALVFLTGMAGTLLQGLWMRGLGLLLGSAPETTATVSVVGLLSLALGAWWLGRRGDAAEQPVRLFGWIQVVLALAALTALPLLESLEGVYVSARHGTQLGPGVLTLLRVGLALAVVGVPGLLLGATLPLVVSGEVRVGGVVGRQAGWASAFLTLGSLVALVLGCTLLPDLLGPERTSWLVAGLFLLSAAIALIAVQEESIADRIAPDHVAAATAEDEPGIDRAMLTATFLAATAAASAEVLWLRYLVKLAGDDTPITGATVRTTLLFGVALGALLGGWFSKRRGDPIHRFGGFLVAAGVTCIGSLVGLSLLAPGRFLSPAVDGWSAVWEVLGTSAGVVVAPAAFHAALFPLAARLTVRMRGRVGGHLGRLLAIQGLGLAVGGTAGAFLALPLLGLRTGLILIGSLLSLLGIAVLLRVRPVDTPRRAVGLAAALTAVALVGSLRFEDPAPRAVDLPLARVVFAEDGPGESIAVLETNDGELVLLVNGDRLAGTALADQTHLRLLGHLPALLHPAPERGLVLGFGAGIAAGSLARHPLKRIDLVERSRSLIRGSFLWQEHNHDPLHDPQVHLTFDDPRNHLLASDRTYDVIVTTPVDPSDSGASQLLGTEYFELVHAHLNEGGIASQWLPTDMDVALYRAMLRSFQRVFPDTTIWFGSFTTVLVGRKDGPGVSYADLRDRFADGEVRDSLAQVGIVDAPSLLSLQVADPDQVAGIARTGPLVTDDRPLLELGGPRVDPVGDAEDTRIWEVLRGDAPPARPLVPGPWTWIDLVALQAPAGWVPLLLERESLFRRPPRDAAHGDQRARRFAEICTAFAARPLPRLAQILVGLEHVEPDPDLAPALINWYRLNFTRGNAALAEGELEEARRLFEAAGGVPGTVRPDILSASTFAREGRPVEALERVLLIDPGDGSAPSLVRRLPHAMMHAVFAALDEAQDAAVRMDLLARMVTLLPAEAERPPGAPGTTGPPRPGEARPAPAESEEGPEVDAEPAPALDDIDAWRAWWDAAEHHLEGAQGRFRWTEEVVRWR